jgi:Tfp pilus assembly protein PilX
MRGSHRSAEACRRLREERGIILPISIMLLSVILVLTLVVAAASVQNNNFSNQQVAGDQALATAEAGLQTAYHRLYSVATSGTEIPAADCFTTTAVVPESGSCKAETGKVGANSYTYYVEPLTSETKKHCAGLPVVGAIVQRCITASATVSGVTRRVQERVVVSTQSPASELESLGRIKINNAKNLDGNLAANAEVEVGTATVTGVIRGKPIGKKFTCSGCTEKEEEDAVDGGKAPEVESEPPERRAAAYESAALEANNKADTSKFKAEAGAAYTEATRILLYSKQFGSPTSPVLLESGVYNFCEVNFTERTYFEVPSGAEVTWYIDAPGRPGADKCAQEGKFKATNGFCVKNATKNPADFKLDFWGNKQHPSEFAFTNNVGECEPLIADAFAPFTKFTVTNGGSISGNFLMSEIEATNGLELGVAPTSAGGNAYAASAWEICNRSPSSSSPASGCY